MALQKKYDETPLQVLTTRRIRARIRRLKTRTGRSQAAILRDMIDIALPMYEEMHGLGDAGDDGLGDD